MKWIPIGVAAGLVATVLIWPGTLLIPVYLAVWVMNGGHP